MTEKPKVYQLGDTKKRFSIDDYIKYVSDDGSDPEELRQGVMAAFELHEFAPFLVMPGKRQKVGKMMYIEPVEVDRPDDDQVS